MSRLAAIAAASVFALSTASCGSTTRVPRVIDGRVVMGRFVEPEAYALFLRGAVAESNGAYGDALRAYETLARLDESDPEVFARIARTRCARDPHDPRARAALERAFALDSDYGPALAASATCGGGIDVRAAAARVEPRDVSIQVAFARSLEGASGAAVSETGARLLALTLEQGRSSAAIGELAIWANAHDNLDLLVLALAEAPRQTPRLDATVARGALALASEGHLGRARRVATALFEARALKGHAGPPLDEDVRVAVGRLAVDEAVQRGDEAAIERFAVAAHLTQTEAAARAALGGQFGIARRIASATLLADPSDVGARMVLASSAKTQDDVRKSLFEGRSAEHMTAPAIACALFGQAMLRTSGTSAARAALSAVSCDRVAKGDAPVLSLLVELAARDVLDEATLPLEGRIELAWRKREPLGATSYTDLDVRHELLARAQSDPRSPRAGELAARLARRAPTDAIVLAALVAVARARGETLDQLARAALAPPANAVLDAALIDALPVSAPESVRVRARFAGLAATPAERALVH